ncbi:MAG: DnaA ATPase domain-containing protein [bacterium]
MRTKSNWNNNIKYKFIKKHFTPRLQKDLKTISMPVDLLEYPKVSSTYIWGKIKTGKTVRAAQYLLRKLELDYYQNKTTNAEFLSFPIFIDKIKETYNDKTKNDFEIISKYSNIDFLVIDDFMTVRPSDWLIDTVYKLINYRYEYLKTTIITCNYSLEELEGILNDQRITSRIDRMCEIEEKTSW